MPAPLLFILMPLVAAPLVYGLYRVRGWLDVWMAGGVVALLAVFARFLPFSSEPFIQDTFSLLGRAFVLEAADRGTLVNLFATSTLIFFATGLNRQGRFFLPAGLAVLSFLVAALSVRPFLFAAIFLQIAAALSVFMLADGRLVTSRGALRYLSFTTLGVPFILFTGWLLDSYAANPEEPRWLTWAALTLLTGLFILLGVVPFHSWLPIVAENSPPLATAFVLGVARLPLALFMVRLLNTYEWLGANAGVLTLLTTAGMVMVIVGGAFALGQRNLSRSLGYAAVINYGVIFLGVGQGTAAGVQAALADCVLGGLGIALWAAGLETLRRSTSSGEMTFEALQGLGWRYPFAVAAVAIGALSFSGVPLMAGFPARWNLLQLLAGENPWLAVLVVAAMLSLGLVVLRGLAALTTPASPDEVIEPQESRWNMAALSLGMLLVILIGAFPQLIFGA
jgi:formate hydrogenlyase subunit 3/multisubunit Na+/H+ antiporter MnhD subunit